MGVFVLLAGRPPGLEAEPLPRPIRQGGYWDPAAAGALASERLMCVDRASRV